MNSYLSTVSSFVVSSFLFFVPAAFADQMDCASGEEKRSVPCYIDQKTTASEEPCAPPANPCCKPEKKWYFELKPGYFFLEDKEMRQFFGNGGFSCRGEAGCELRGPLMVWIDGGYYQESGTAIGGTEKLDLKLATLTLGLKWIYYFNSWVGLYAGAGPRLFLMMLHNDSPYVRGDDNAIGLGGGFDAGFWVFPIPQWRNLFLDLFADYSLKNMHIEEDEISSLDSNVNLSGLTVGLGLGIRF